MPWPRDDAKLERVRALMAEHELDALVVRAPDDVLYLTNFWGMKGYDACVFPREGEPVLICLEASEEDAARMAWTRDVRFFSGYDERDPRPPVARVLELAREAASEYGRVGLELSLGTQASDRMVGEPTTFTAEWFAAFGESADATPLLAAARAVKTEQEIERMRLANTIAAAAMEHCKLVIDVGMTEAQIAAEWEGFVHGEGTGWDGKVELALGYSLVWSGQGIKTFTATTSRAVVEGEPTLFEIWVCADGYWCDHTKNLVVGELTMEYGELERGLMDVYLDAVEFVRPGASFAELDRRIREGITDRVFRASRRTRSATASEREPRTSLRTPGRRRRDGGRYGSCNRARMLYRRRRRPPRRGQLPRDRDGRREALPVPGWDSPDVIDRSKVWTGDLNAKALEPQPRVTIGLYDTTLRDGEQTVGVVLAPEQKVEIARALSAAGVDRIEAGFPRVSDDDARAISLILGAGLDAEIWGFSRAVRADVEALVELGLQASVIESPISDGKLAALGVSRETMLDRIRAAVSFAAAEGIRVAFFAVDSTRADLEFTRRVYEAAVEAGAKEVAVVDTLGIATPEAAAFLVNEVVERLDYAFPSTGTVTTTSASRRRRRLRRCRREPRGCRAPSTVWVSAPGTQISSRSHSRSRRSTGYRRASTCRRRARLASSSRVSQRRPSPRGSR
jgi:Xaa-Pro aminopeptidase